MLDDEVRPIADHKICLVDAHLAQQLQVPVQQATPAKFQQALGASLGIMFRQAASAASG